MSKIKLSIWDRDFELDIYYDCYHGESVLDIQKDAVEQIKKATTAIEISKKELEDYIISKNSEDIGSSNVDNIFKYVMPKNVYIPRNEEKQIVAIMCNYRFDMEHGLAVVFENGQFKEIGEEDIIL